MALYPLFTIVFINDKKMGKLYFNFFLDKE